MNKNLREFEKDLTLNGGATYDIETGEQPENGFIVSVKGSEYTVKAGEDLQKSISEFVRENAVELLKDGSYLGGWLEDGEYVLDVSVVFEDKQKAFEFALSNEQRSFYDMSEGELYRIDKHKRLYKQTPEGLIYESNPLTYDAFHNTQRKQLKRVF